MMKKREKRETGVECIIIILAGNCCLSITVLIPSRMCRQGARQEVISDICGIK